MGRNAPMNPSPGTSAPKATSLASPTSKGSFEVRSGHGTGYAQVSAKTSYPKGGNASGKTLTSINQANGTEYGQVSSNG